MEQIRYMIFADSLPFLWLFANENPSQHESMLPSFLDDKHLAGAD